MESPLLTHNDVYVELMACLDDINTSMIEDELKQVDTHIDPYISEFCLEHFGDDVPASTDMCLDPATSTDMCLASTDISHDSNSLCDNTSPESSFLSSIRVPDHPDEHMDSVDVSCDLPHLSQGKIDSVCGPMDYQRALDTSPPASVCSSPGSGYTGACGQLSQSPDSSFTMADFLMDTVQQPDWTDLHHSSTYVDIPSVSAVNPHPTPVHIPHQDPSAVITTSKQYRSGPSPPHVIPSQNNTSEPYRITPSTCSVSDKPCDSYIAMISKAIMASNEGRLLLGDIYKHIRDNYPYYLTAKNSWKNSVRHNLSTNECFIKCGRARNGKGYYWGIHAACLQAFQTGDFDRRQARRQVQYAVSLRNHFTPSTTVTPTPQNLPTTAGYQHWIC